MRKKTYPVPRFKSAEEEAAYWETHSPLLEGYEGKAQTRPQTRTSIISVRLMGREIGALREAARRQGVGPTTLARVLILRGLSARESLSHLEKRLDVLERKVGRLATG